MSDLSDFDAELLDLAGGGSDDENAEVNTGSAKGSRSPSPAPLPSTEQAPVDTQPSQSPESQRRGVAQKMKKPRGSAARRRKDESEEEGEASSAPSSPNDLGSEAMSESEAESDNNLGVEDEDEDVLYKYERFYHSKEDKTRIDALPMLEREAIITERQDALVKYEQDLKLSRQFRERQEMEARADQKKRKADLDPDEQRKSSRVKTTNGGRLARLDEYKQSRANRGEERNRQRRNADRRHSGSRSRSGSTVGSDKDADGESEVEWDDRAKTQPVEEPPADQRDFEHVRVGRDNIGRVCHFPDFVDAITGCYARVAVGADRETGETIYKMAQIKRFVEGKPYVMEDHRGRKFLIDQHGIFAIGKDEKTMPFISLSTSKFTEREFNSYKRTLAEKNIKLPTKSFLVSKCEDIQELLKQKWNDDQLNAKLALQRAREQAYDQSVGPSHTSPTPKKTNNIQDRMAEVNRINRKKNQEEVRNAQIAARKAELAARRAAEKRHKEKVAAEAAAKAEVEKSKSLQVPDANLDALFDGSDNSRAATPNPPANGEKKVVTSNPKPKTEKPTGLPTFKKRAMDDDIIGAMDLGIDIEI